MRNLPPLPSRKPGFTDCLHFKRIYHEISFSPTRIPPFTSEILWDITERVQPRDQMSVSLNIKCSYRRRFKKWSRWLSEGCLCRFVLRLIHSPQGWCNSICVRIYTFQSELHSGKKRGVGYCVGLVTTLHLKQFGGSWGRWEGIS